MRADRVGIDGVVAGGTAVRAGRHSRPMHSRVALNRRPRRRGAAIVETAIVISLFFFLLVSLEMARMGMANQLITNAAREGVRVAVVPGNQASDVSTAVQSFLNSNSGGITTYTLTITPSDPTTTHLGDQVTVQVSTSFGNISWLAHPLFLGSVTLSSSSTLSSERP